jgi:hypothetical protein
MLQKVHLDLFWTHLRQVTIVEAHYITLIRAI